MPRSALIVPGLICFWLAALALGAALEAEQEKETEAETEPLATRRVLLRGQPAVPPTPRWGANMQMLRRHNSRYPPKVSRNFKSSISRCQ